MGKVVSIFADGRLHRQILDRIEMLEIAPKMIIGNLYLKLTVTGYVDHDWLREHVAFYFNVNDGERILVGRCPGVTKLGEDGENTLCARIEFRDPETGSEKLLGEWATLQIILVAGKEEKPFTMSKEENQTPEIKEIL